MKPTLLLFLAALVGLAHGQLSPTEVQGIRDSLYVGNLTLRDLQYERRPFNDAYRLALVDLAIDQPLEAADRIMRFHQAGATKSLSQLIRVARSMGLSDPNTLTIVNGAHDDDRDLKKLPAALRQPVKRLADSVSDANAIVKRALSGLTAEERRTLIETLPLYANEDSSIKFSFTKRTSFDGAKVLALVGKIDLVAIRAAAELLSSNVEALRPTFERAAKSVRQRLDLKLRIDGLRVDVSGVENNLHTDTDAVITLDLGGDDDYRGRAGAGIGYCSVLIDLGGDDRFQMSDLALGTGVLGVGLAYDYHGNDSFRCRSLALGCGLAGVGAFYHEGGNDTYDAVSLSQGYGEFGLGIFCDTAGDDRYDGGYNVQGAARTGGVGWLIDQTGDDVYRAGGLILNSPLFATVHYSNAQGYGSGYREDTGGTSGGIGLLTDLHGRDSYIGETYCQAASYWFSLGSLYDAEGNDTYSAYHYAQSSAMHATAAYLFDLAGDDAYICKLGAGHAIGHDYGVAFFLDRAGMDLYAAHDSRPAVGNANGLAIFIDSAGDDRYAGPPSIGNAARGSGSLAVFADLGGTDAYGDGLSDGQAATRGTWAVALDEASAPTPGAATTPAPTPPPTPGSLPMPSDAEMEKIYRLATQWGVGTAQQQVNENVARLQGIGKPALRWMLDHHLKTTDRLQNRAFVAVVRALGTDGGAMLAPLIASSDVDTARNALVVAMAAGIKEGGPYVPAALKKPELQRIAAGAAGPLGSRESIPDLLPLTVSKDRLTALNAMVSLIALADPTSVATAEALLASDDLPIRKAAIQLIGKFPDQALSIGTRLTRDADEKTIRIGIEILGNLGTAPALDAVGKLLSGPQAGVRMQALQALDGRVPTDYRSAVIDARKDRDPLVRAVAARIDLGR